MNRYLVIVEDTEYKGGWRKDDECKIFIRSGGKDMPTPVNLKKVLVFLFVSDIVLLN